MAKLQPIQVAYNAGELTPRLLGNPNAEVYKRGVSEMRNMYPLAQGPALSRGGDLYVDTLGNPDAIRLMPFNVARGSDYVVELGPLYLRLYDLDGRVDLGGQNIVIDAGWLREYQFWTDLSSGGASITFLPSVLSISLNSLNGSNTAKIGQKMEVIDVADVGSAFNIEGSAGANGSITIRIGTSSGLGDIFAGAVAPGDFFLTFTATATDMWISYENTQASTSSVLERTLVKKSGLAIEIVTPYTAEDLPFLQYEMISASNELFIASENHHPKHLTRVDAVTWDFQDVGFIDPPPEWVAGNYPGVMTVFQGRSWFARTPQQLQTIWSSKSGDYLTFTPGTAQADDPITVTIASPGEIEWMRGQKDLLMGTDLGEFRISSQSGIITPGDIDIRQQSAYGSATLIQAQNIGDQVLYVSPDAKKVRALTFDAFKQGWYSPDLTWIAEHITDTLIKEIHFARDPDNLIICVLNDGEYLMCNYDNTQKSLGWSRHSNPDSHILSAAVVAGPFGSATFFARRQDNGNAVLTVFPANRDARRDIDSSINRVVEPGNIVTGLDYLEGMEVTIKADGAVHPKKTVVGGQITLDYPSVTAEVGLGFTARLVTLPLDVGSATGSGSPEVKHWNKIYIRLLDSEIPIVNGIRNPTRHPQTPMNRPEPPHTEALVVTTLGRTNNAIITIEQDLPLKLEILNMFGEEGQYSI